MVALIIFLLGLVVGSFLTVVSYRLPRAKQFIFGRSVCPNCGSKIAALDNVPILSYITLRGRCRRCGNRISFRYPLIEASTAVIFISLYWHLGACAGSPICVWKDILGPLALPFLLIVFSLVILVFTIDLERRIIPDGLSFFALGTVLLALFLGGEKFYLHLFSGIIVSLFLLLIHLVTRGKGMGLGDVKFALFAGVFFGWPLALIWLFSAFLTGAIVAIILMLLGTAGRKDKIAFGPFLAISFVLTAFWGDKILSALLL